MSHQVVILLLFVYNPVKSFESMAAEKVQLYCSWFCPFAQRAWLGLLSKGIEFEYIEQNPYDKNEAWLAVNPRGLVPTIVHKGKIIYESSICLEYIEDAWPNLEPHLLPKDPSYERAKIRICKPWNDNETKYEFRYGEPESFDHMVGLWKILEQLQELEQAERNRTAALYQTRGITDVNYTAEYHTYMQTVEQWNLVELSKNFSANTLSDHITKKFVPNNFRILQRQEKPQQDEAKSAILQSLRELFDNAFGSGPFFGGSSVNMIDLMLFPWTCRFFVFKHYRNFEVPQKGFENYHAWTKAMESLEFVRKTLPDKEKSIAFDSNYADDTATSEAAKAIRKGDVIP